MTSTTYSAWLPRAAFACLTLLHPLSLFSQGSQPITAAPVARVALKAGEATPVKVRFQLANGYHTNSNTPSDEYLIPLRLTWDAAPVEVSAIEYPKAHLEKYSFAEKPLSVFTGDFEILTRLKAAPSVPKGPRVLKGKLRYQACTSTACLPPKTLPVEIPLDIR